MSLFGIELPSQLVNTIKFHKILQLHGFLTLLIMGIGYMIVPRFRNISIPYPAVAYLSFLLVVSSIVVSFLNDLTVSDGLETLSATLKLSGITIFACMMLWTMRISPKLLRMADYFIVLSIVSLAIMSTLQLEKENASSLNQIQMWLAFPFFMILGIEYKTLPAFLGFIRPRKKLATLSLYLAATTTILGIASVWYDAEFIKTFFSVVFLATGISFAFSVYIFGGFDSSEILKLSKGEKRIRYVFTVQYVRAAFLFLFVGGTMAILFNIFPKVFLWYDLAIHFIAIGFIGITIMLYLPMMLPPVVGKSIRFLDFSKLPLVLILTALSIRSFGDYTLMSLVLPLQLSYILLDYLAGLWWPPCLHLSS